MEARRDGNNGMLGIRMMMRNGGSENENMDLVACLQIFGNGIELKNLMGHTKFISSFASSI